MPSTAPSNASAFRFFLLVFALAIPLWLIGAAAGVMLPLPMNLPVSALQAFCPLLAAVILTRRHEGGSGVKRLLRRLTDVRISPKAWYLPAIALLPVIYLTSYTVMRLTGRPLPEPHVTWLAAPPLLLVFLAAAAGEEGGWLGYAAERLPRRWTALTCGLVLGAIWGAFHVVPDLQAGRSMEWIVWQRGVYDIALRVLIVWLFTNSGRSLFAAMVMHATDNVSASLFPNGGSHYDPAVTAAVTSAVAAIIVFLWGARTLSNYRYAPRRSGAGR